ncbi:MAG: M14 family zinc carboxypeptidase [Flavobacteriaceae bacterium]
MFTFVEIKISMIKHELFLEEKLSGRYITNKHIEPLIDVLKDFIEVENVGVSVDKKPIYALKFGAGKKRILAWSQMHGNESTTTKALFDFFNTLKTKNDCIGKLLLECSFCIIPILNPDGAERYTRFNANEVDLNRDAQKLSQPESQVLKQVYMDFKPDYCLNLHGQRSIFSAGYSSNSSVMSFLSPAENEQRAVTKTRKKAMEVILAINSAIKDELPNQVSRYDDGFNADCVGDSFQMLKTPTILFEAGHFSDDYHREVTRKHMFKALVAAFEAIALNSFDGSTYQDYFKLPENQKLFFDIIIRNVVDANDNIIDVAIQYSEVLDSETVKFVPKVAKVGDLSEFFGHKEIDGGNNSILINKTGNIDDLLLIINEISINGVDYVKNIAIK